jgi:hypothetical protein
VKAVDISGTKGEYLKVAVNELKTDCKNTNIRDLHGDINEFQKNW